MKKTTRHCARAFCSEPRPRLRKIFSPGSFLNFFEKRKVITLFQLPMANTIVPSLEGLQVIIIPRHSRTNLAMLTTECQRLETLFREAGIKGVAGDYRETHKAEWKYQRYEQAGVRVRIEFGERDLFNNCVCIAYRDENDCFRQSAPFADMCRVVKELLDKS